MQASDVIVALWVVWPMYFANGFAPLARGRRSLDFGKYLGSSRVFGDGKTFEGFGFALIAGLAVGGFQETIYAKMLHTFPYLPSMTPLIGITLAFGAMAGDLVAAFFKRRLNMQRGESFPLVDQLDFIIGGVSFITASGLLKINWSSFFVLLIITPFVHLSSSWVGYKLGIKREPW
ncbi:MAG: CDP-2,3-bis-(O-geranylgeranyl)-sn-glycerol synthase [Candidatus Aenigmarchaeota archaeon]|nr:CDP-2,3-bis-(O-geranylgeranyl)-sn-glycerol synthase [Candidatus Aenigmarchaeota archaeon]